MMAAKKDRAFLDVETSLSGQRWQARLDVRGRSLAESIAQDNDDISDILARVLAARDVPSDAVGAYLNPTIRDLLPDPSHLTEMDAAAERLANAIQARETIAIFGDYDVDGATSSAILWRKVG